MRIANAITDLRRPSSFIYSETGGGGGSPGSISLQRSPSLIAPHSPFSITHPQGASGQGQGQGHSRAQSQAYSTRSFPGSGSIGIVGVGQGYNFAPMQGNSIAHGNGNAGYVESPEPMYHMPPGKQVQGQYPEPVGMSASAPTMAVRNGKINVNL